MKPLSVFLLFSCLTLNAFGQTYDVVIRNGTLYDGTGAAPTVGDLAIQGDKIAAMGKFPGRGKREIDVHGMAVAPGFVNMLSHAYISLLRDGRSLSDIRQGVTLEVFGEVSMGPLSENMKAEMRQQQDEEKFDVSWTTLGEFMRHLEQKGVATNFASFVSASEIREHELQQINRDPTPAELDHMKALVAQAMQEGAMGLTTALIYVPATFAKTDELVAMAKVASEYGGIFTAHMRSEGDRFEAAVDEMIAISKRAKIPVEIYHLKAAGKSNWQKLDRVIAKIDSARQAGLAITANMYNYTAGATGLDAAMPPWVQEGGLQAWRQRLQDPETRQKVAKAMTEPAGDWENLALAAGPEGMILQGFKQDSLRKYVGKTLAEVAAQSGQPWYETAMDLVVMDDSRVGTAYFLMSEENVKKQIALPYMSFGSDAASIAPEGNRLKGSPHPRTYGNFARLLGKYVREEKVISLSEAVRRLTSLPCQNLHIPERGSLKPGYFADVVLFDPARIGDVATYDQPHQLAEGVVDVFVNGTLVLEDGKPTGATPGRAVYGPGKK
ncbi:N-acyl-D-amino-acid deacylase family protein [Persicitalea jodogahamensis]|uniref:Aminoacylase n=1 Tax=Persicitalea jodogahamensis TaxID=402147 RepID=A0A8J3G9Z2_9BACT|nr:D-aminoacylase [Persicitalea jodogahamensis]GHB79431.1 aminoacylase [Persicitalea jodogahamensis]